MNLRQRLEEASRQIEAAPIPVETTEGLGNDAAYWCTHRERFYRTAKLFLQLTHQAPERVLDLGSHFLHFACLLKTLGYQVYGGDVSEFANHPNIQERARRLAIHNASIEPVGRCRELPFVTGQFDVIFLLEAVEHWNANPSGLLKEIYRVMSPEGRLIVSTPNFYGYHEFGRKIVRFLTGWGGYQPVEDIVQNPNFSHHWKEYSRKELRKLLGAFGFSLRSTGSLTGIGDGTPEWVGRVCQPWGRFLYMEFQKSLQ